MKHAKNVQSPVQLSARRKLYLAVAAQFMLASQAYAGPTGGEVVGGQGSISQLGNETTIIQDTDHLSIDWQTFNIAADERVEFIQPGADSVALNRVLGHDASNIFGQLDANGTVVLVNPNGVFFGEGASVNVGGLVASGLMVNPEDFMNGDFAFEAIEGSDGAVVNSGLINASVGGSVVLMGKQVENKGLITAKLGKVSLAAGKEAVLSFDSQGLIGVRVSKEILQNEIGVDEAAVINSGDIDAEGGKILLTASVSQDVFTQAVNAGEFDSKASVVMHEDGSFTLGGGSEVVNTGLLSVASDTENAGDVVILGENVTHEGKIFAESNGAGSAGHVEVHAKDTAVVAGQGSINVEATQQGKGGDVKVFGDRVGLFDDASINASGVNGGGDVLIGGDFQGKNDQIKNATQTVVGTNTSITADAGTDGGGGRVILWADDTTVFKGDISVTGGSNSGDGGFVEVSGKENLSYRGDVDTRAVNGESGTLLLDPETINIVGGTSAAQDSELSDGFIVGDEDPAIFEISVSAIEQALQSSDVTLQASNGNTSTINFDPNNEQLSLYSNSGNDLTLVSQILTFSIGGSVDIAGNLSMDFQLPLINGSTRLAADNITYTLSGGATAIQLQNLEWEVFNPRNSLILDSVGSVSLSGQALDLTIPNLVLEAPTISFSQSASLTLPGDLTINVSDTLNLVSETNISTGGQFNISTSQPLALDGLNVIDSGGVNISALRGVTTENALINSRGGVTIGASIGLIDAGNIYADGLVDLSGQSAIISNNITSNGLIVSSRGIDVEAGVAVDAGVGVVQLESGPGNTSIEGTLQGGNVTIGGNSLNLEGTISADDLTLTARGDGGIIVGSVFANNLNIDTSSSDGVVVNGDVDVNSDLLIDTTQGTGSISISNTGTPITVSAGNKIELFSGGDFNLSYDVLLNAGAGGVLARADGSVFMAAASGTDLLISSLGDIDIRSGSGNFTYGGGYAGTNVRFGSSGGSINPRGSSVIDAEDLVFFSFDQGRIFYNALNVPSDTGDHTINAASFEASAQNIEAPDLVINIDSSNSSLHDGDVTLLATGLVANRSISLPSINQINYEAGSQLLVSAIGAGSVVGASDAALAANSVPTINYDGEVVFDVIGELNLENVDLNIGSADLRAVDLVFGDEQFISSGSVEISSANVRTQNASLDVSGARLTFDVSQSFRIDPGSVIDAGEIFLTNIGTTQIRGILNAQNINLDILSAFVDGSLIASNDLNADFRSINFGDAALFSADNIKFFAKDADVNAVGRTLGGVDDAEIIARNRFEFLPSSRFVNFVGFNFDVAEAEFNVDKLAFIDSTFSSNSGVLFTTNDNENVTAEFLAQNTTFNMNGSDLTINSLGLVDLEDSEILDVGNVSITSGNGQIVAPEIMSNGMISLESGTSLIIRKPIISTGLDAVSTGRALVSETSNIEVGDGDINITVGDGATGILVINGNLMGENVGLISSGDVSFLSIDNPAITGQVNAQNVKLEATAGNVTLGNINFGNLLEVYSASGEVTQLAGTRIYTPEQNESTALFDTNGNKLTLTSPNNVFNRIGFNNVLNPEIVSSNLIRWVGHNQDSTLIDSAVEGRVTFSGNVIEIEQEIDYSNFTSSSGSFDLNLTADTAVNFRGNIYSSASPANALPLNIYSAASSAAPINTNVISNLYLSGGDFRTENTRVTFDKTRSDELKTNYLNANTKLGDNLGGVYLSNAVGDVLLPEVDTGTLFVSTTGRINQRGLITASRAELIAAGAAGIDLSQDPDSVGTTFLNDFDFLSLDVTDAPAVINEVDDIIIESIVSRDANGTAGGSTITINARQSPGSVTLPVGESITFENGGQLNIYSPQLVIDGEIILNNFTTLNVNTHSFEMSGRIASDVGEASRFYVQSLSTGLSSVNIAQGAEFENIIGVDDDVTSYIALSGIDAVANISADIPFMLQTHATNSTVFNINEARVTIDLIRGSDGRDTIVGEIGTVNLNEMTVDTSIDTKISFENIEYFDGDGLQVIGANVDSNWTLGINSLDRVEFIDAGGNNQLIEFTSIGTLNGGSASDSISIAGERFVDTYVFGGGGTDVVIMDRSSAAIDSLLFETNALHELYFGNIDDLLLSEKSRYKLVSEDLTNSEVYWIGDVEQFVGGDGRDAYFIYTNESSSGIPFDGGNGDDFLFSWYYPDDPTATVQWNILGVNSGDVDGLMTFQNVENIGGDFTQASQDIFNLSANAVLNNIYGGDGADQFIFNEGAQVAGIFGGAGVDVVDYSNIASDIDIYLTDAGGISGVSEIEVIEGNANEDITSSLILASDVIDSDWNLRDPNGAYTVSYTVNGTTYDLAFRGFNNLQGAGGTDHFIIEGSANFDGQIIGNGGSDTLEVDAASNRWTLVDQGQGTLEVTGTNGRSNVDFEFFENLVGCAKEDIFDIQTANIGGMRFEGGSAYDTFLLTANEDVLVEVTRQNDSTVGSISVAGNTAQFIQMEALEANSGQNNTLIGADTVATWVINDPNDNDPSGIEAGHYVIDSESPGFDFINIQNLQGGSSDDLFVINNENVNVNIDGGGGQDYLEGMFNDDSFNNTWNITGNYSGNLNSNAEFTNIPNLVGNAGDDTFDFAENAVIGDIEGGAGYDTVNINQGIQAGLISAGADGGVINELTSTIVKTIKNEQIDVLGNSASYSLDDEEEVPFDISFGAGSTTQVVGIDNYDALWNLDENGQLTVRILNDRSNDETDDTDAIFDFGGEEISSLQGAGGDDHFVLYSLGGLDSPVLGGSGDDTLQIASVGDNTWNINSQFGGDVVFGSNPSNTSFDEIEFLVGGEQADTFNFLVENCSIVVDGGAGADAIFAFDKVNNWVINGTQSGTLNSKNFVSIENLTGGNQQDNFTFAVSDVGAININAGAAAENNQMITSHSADVLWNINADGTVVYQGDVVSDGISAINGSDGNDHFVFESDAASNLVIDAGADGGDLFDYSEISGDLTVSVDANAGSINGIVVGGSIDRIVGNTADSSSGNTATLVMDGDNYAANQQHIWNIAYGAVSAGAQAGQSSVVGDVARVSDAGTAGEAIDFELAFEAFNALQGGAISDAAYVDIDHAAQANFSFDGGVGEQNYLHSGQSADAAYRSWWRVDGDDTGVLLSQEVAGGAAGNWQMAFSNVSSLSGDVGEDRFDMYVADARPSIDGGLGDRDVVSFSVLADGEALTVDLSDATFLTNVEKVIGNGTDSVLVGPNQVNFWDITGAQTGQLENGVSFEAFETLQGGTVGDTFYAVDSAAQINLVGVAASNTLQSDVADITNNWDLNGSGSGTLNAGVSFSGISQLVGSEGVDNFSDSAAAVFDVVLGRGGADTFEFLNGSSITILNAGQGADVITLSNGTQVDDLYAGAGDDTISLGNAVVVASVYGEAGSDSVTLLDGSSVSLIDGGTDDTDDAADGVVDFLDLAQLTQAEELNLQTGKSSLGFDEIGFEDKTPAGDGSGLFSGDGDFTWTFFGDNSFTVSGTNGGVTYESTSNATYSSVRAGEGTHTFVFEDGATFSGSISGSATANNSLTGNDILDQWLFNASNSGQVSGGGSTTTFANIASIFGGSADDTFTVAETGSILSLDGGAGQNALIVQSAAGVNNSWTLGSVNSLDNQGTERVGQFAAINRIQSVGSDDVYTFNGPIAFESIDAGQGTNVITWNAGAGDLAVNLGESTLNDATTVSGINEYNANGVNATLIGTDVGSTWTLVDGRSGLVDDGANPAIAFSGFNAIEGSASNQDVISGPGLDSDWTLSGVDQGQLLTVTDNDVMSFANIERIEASSATDRLILTADAYLSAGFDGGAGTDSILGAADQSNSFIVGGAFEGTAERQDFTSVENLKAGNMGDGFLLLAEAQINDLIGGDGQDQFEITEGAVFASIEGGADADLMIVSGGDNAWQLDNSGGTLNGQRFDRVEVLVGGDGVDQFVLTEANINATDVDGGDGADSLTGADVDNVWSLAAGTLNDSLSFLNIEQLNGGSAVDTIQGDDVANEWAIDGLAGSVGAFNFSDMNIIVGGTTSDVVSLQGATELLEVRTGDGDDQVSLASGTQFSGVIYGGDGNDYLDLSNFEGGREYSVDIDSYVDSFSQFEFETVDDSEGNIFFGGENDVRWVFLDDSSFYVEVLDASGAVVKTVNSDTVGEFSQVRSGTGTNTFELAADAVFDGQISASAQGENTLVGTDLINQWLITGANSGSVQVEGTPDQTLLFSNIARLIGGSQADNFTIEEGGSLAYVDAGEGADTLRMNTLSAQQWQLNSSVGGTLNTSDAVRLFGSVETIYGTDQGDLFVLTANDSDVLNIVAGTGSDTIDFGDLGASVDLETAIANGYQVSGVDNYIATSGGLNGADANNTWQLSAGGSQVQWSDANGDSQTVAFDGFNVLQGGEANDTFVVDGRWSQAAPLIVSANGGEDSITVNTGAQNTLWYYSSGGIVQTFLDDDGAFTQGLADPYDRTGLQNQLSQADMQFNGFESHVGGDGSDIFYAYSDDTSVSFDGAGGVDTLVGHQWVSNPDVQVWSLTGNSLNSGAQGDINSVVSFDGIEVFASDAAQTSNNQFVIVDSVSIESIVTQGGDDQFVIGADAVVGLIDAGTGADTIQAPDAANNWVLGDTESSLNQVNFTGVETLVGGALADDYALQSANASVTISTIDAQGGDDSFTGFDEANTWLVDAAGHSLNGDIALANVEFLVGGADVDSFQLTSAVAVTIEGGDGQDQLQAFDQANNWIFSEAGSSINSEVYFSGVEDFIGGAQVDSVIVESGGSFNSFDTAGGNDSLTLLDGALVSGAVSGGAGQDALDIEQYSAGNEFDYDIGGIRDGLNYSGFEDIKQNENISFYGGAGDTRWVFTGESTFYIEKLAADGSVIETSIEYPIYSTVRGGDGVNTFELASDALFDGTINGSANGDNTLLGSDLINQWLIDGDNSGSISSGETQTIFINIAQLIGGSNSDNFEIALGGSVTGLIDGGAGSDSLAMTDDSLQNQWNLGAQNALAGIVAQFQGIEAIVGNAGSDLFNISDLSDVTSIDGASGADQVIWSGSELAVNLGTGTLNSKSFASIESLEADAAEQNQVVGADYDSTWSLTGADQLQATYSDGTDTITVTFSNFGSVTGGAAQDELSVANGSLSVGFDGGDGEDTLIASDLSNAWQLAADSGDVNGLNFSGVEVAVGGASDDSFTMLAASTEVQSIQGAGGSDSLQAFDQDNNWMIDTNGPSSVTGLASFEGIENFYGGSVVDTVVVAAGSSFEDLDTDDGDDSITIYSNVTANNIYTGDGTDNAIIYMGLQLSGVIDGGADQSVNGTYGGNLHLGNFTSPNGAPPTEENIEAIVGFDYQNFFVSVLPQSNGTFAAGDGNNTWYITGVNQGRVVVEDGPNQGTYNFEDIHTLIGGEGNDTFIFENENALIETSITGGDGGFDTIDYSSQSWVVDWLFNGANQGSASANNQSLLFSNIAKVIGSSGNDTFNIADGASISDGVDAGNGLDWAVANNTQDNAWTLSANGTQFNTSIAFTGLEAIQGAGTVDTFNVTDANAEVSQIVGGGASDILNILYAQAVTADMAQGLIGQLSIQDIENINASTNGNRIVAADNNNSWLIAADGSVAVSYLVDQSNEQLVFTGFNSLQGGDLQDNFTVAANAGFAGTIDGGAGSDALTHSNGDNTWTVTADNEGQVGQIAFAQVERLEGGSGADYFDIAADAIVSEGVDGGAGTSDRITHRGDAKDWILEMVDAKAGGRVAGTQFSAIENLDGAGTQDRILGGSSDNTWTIGDNANNTYVDLANDTTLRIRYQGMEAYLGGDGSDIFNILNLQALPSAIEGGAGVDSLNLQTVNADLNVAMGGSQALPAGGNGIAINNIENVQANRQQRTVVYGNSDQAYSWLIDGARSAQVTASITDENAQTIYFEDISALVGGDHDDTFTVTTNNTSISIDGGDAQNLDFVDYSQVNANVSINLANGVSAAGTIAGIEGVRGNAAGGASLNSSEIIASDAVNTWTIGDLDGDGAADGINDGSVTSVNGTVYFEDFNIITGGAQADTFELAGGAIRGTIRGGAGNDTLNAEVVGLNAGTVFDGGGDVDTMNLTGGGDDYLAVYTPNQNGGEFNYTAANVDYSIAHQNVENLNDNVLAQTLEIRGSSAIETFVINNSNFGINQNTPVSYSNKTNLFVNADQSDAINIGENLVIEGTLALANGSVVSSDPAGTSITANQLLLDGTRDVGTRNGRIRTNVEELSARNVEGDVYLSEVSDLDIVDLDVTGEVDIVVQNGDLVASGVLQSEDDFRVVAVNGNIRLLEDNRLEGDIALEASAGSVDLYNTVDTRLADITANVLNVETEGSLDLDGAVTVATDASFVADDDIDGNDAVVVQGTATFESGRDIRVTDSANDFNVLVVNGADNVEVEDQNGIVLGGIAASGEVEILAEGIEVAEQVVADSIYLDAQQGVAMLNAILDAEPGNDVTVIGQDIIQNADIFAGRDIVLTAVDTIERNATAHASNELRINADNVIVAEGASTEGRQVIITATNDLEVRSDVTGDSVSIGGGRVIIDGSVTARDGDANVNGNTLVNIGGAVSGNNNVNVSTNEGDVEQSGTIASNTGTTTVNAGGAGNINMNGNAQTSGNDVKLDAGNNILLGGVTAKETVEVKANTGDVKDNNGEAANITAENLVSESQLGFGNDDAIETDVSNVKINNGVQDVNFANVGEKDIVVESIQTQGNVGVESERDIELGTGSIVANSQDGSGGKVKIETSQGGIKQSSEGDGPAIVSKEVVLDARNGEIGQGNRLEIDAARIDLNARVKTGQLLVKAGTDVNEYFSGSFKFEDQIVSVEQLEDVNPAVFTNVKSYFHNDISLRLPSDQLYEEDEEY